MTANPFRSPIRSMELMVSRHVPGRVECELPITLHHFARVPLLVTTLTFLSIHIQALSCYLSGCLRPAESGVEGTGKKAVNELSATGEASPTYVCPV